MAPRDLATVEANQVAGGGAAPFFSSFDAAVVLKTPTRTLLAGAGCNHQLAPDMYGAGSAP